MNRSQHRGETTINIIEKGVKMNRSQQVIQSLTEDAYNIVADILSNDESSTDAEVIDLLNDETDFDKDRLKKLVKEQRSNILKGGGLNAILKIIKKYI